MKYSHLTSSSSSYLSDLMEEMTALTKDVTVSCSDGVVRWNSLMLSHWSSVSRTILPQLQDCWDCQDQDHQAGHVIVAKDFKVAVAEKVLNWSLKGQWHFQKEDKEEVLSLLLALGVIPALSTTENQLLCVKCGQGFTSIDALNKHVEREHCATTIIGDRDSGDEQNRLGDPYFDIDDKNLDSHDQVKDEEFYEEWNDEVGNDQGDIDHVKLKKKGRPRKKVKLKEEEEESDEEQEVETKCSTCQETFANKRDLRHHEKSAHAQSSSSSETHLCDACGGSFASQQSLSVHRFRKHGLGSGKKCPLCTKAFMDNCNLRKHIATVHEGRKDFLCGTCGSSFAYKVHLVLTLICN